MRRALRSLGGWIDSPHGGFVWNTFFAAASAACATNDTGLPRWVNVATAVVLGLIAVRCALEEFSLRGTDIYLTVDQRGITFSGPKAGEGR